MNQAHAAVTMSPADDVVQWARELRAAGWEMQHMTLWKAPCGCLHRGPYNAWCVMIALKDAGVLCPLH